MASGLEIKHARELHIVRWIVVLILLAGIGAGIYFGVRWYNTGEQPPLPFPVVSADPSINEEPVTKEQIAAHKVDPNHPRYLSIPSLEVVDTRVMSVGLTPQNLLEVPDGIDDAGWYTKSATPGSGVGSVMIDGHNGGLTRSGVFAKLQDLSKGDEIVIERGDGEKFTYAVYDVRNMTLKEANATGMKEMMLSADPSKEGLSLITCAGNWVPKDKVFDRRVMVRAISVE